MRVRDQVDAVGERGVPEIAGVRIGTPVALQGDRNVDGPGVVPARVIESWFSERLVARAPEAVARAGQIVARHTFHPEAEGGGEGALPQGERHAGSQNILIRNRVFGTRGVRRSHDSAGGQPDHERRRAVHVPGIDQVGAAAVVGGAADPLETVDLDHRPPSTVSRLDRLVHRLVLRVRPRPVGIRVGHVILSGGRLQSQPQREVPSPVRFGIEHPVAAG